MNAIDEEIIRLRVNGRLSPAKIAMIMQVTEPYIEKAIGRLIDEGRLDGGNVAAALNTSIPPTKLDGSAAYGQAAHWLVKWGVSVTWERHKGEDHPKIEGRLTHRAELVDRYIDERRKWQERQAAGHGGLPPATTKGRRFVI
jgi:hypothetical protein